MMVAMVIGQLQARLSVRAVRAFGIEQLQARLLLRSLSGFVVVVVECVCFFLLFVRFAFIFAFITVFSFASGFV